MDKIEIAKQGTVFADGNTWHRVCCDCHEIQPDGLHSNTNCVYCGCPCVVHTRIK